MYGTNSPTKIHPCIKRFFATALVFIHQTYSTCLFFIQTQQNQCSFGPSTLLSVSSVGPPSIPSMNAAWLRKNHACSSSARYRWTPSSHQHTEPHPCRSACVGSAAPNYRLLGHRSSLPPPSNGFPAPAAWRTMRSVHGSSLPSQSVVVQRWSRSDRSVFVPAAINQRRRRRCRVQAL